MEVRMENGERGRAEESLWLASRDRAKVPRTHLQNSLPLSNSTASETPSRLMLYALDFGLPFMQLLVVGKKRREREGNSFIVLVVNCKVTKSPELLRPESVTSITGRHWVSCLFTVAAASLELARSCRPNLTNLATTEFGRRPLCVPPRLLSEVPLVCGPQFRRRLRVLAPFALAIQGACVVVWPIWMRITRNTKPQVVAVLVAALLFSLKLFPSTN